MDEEENELKGSYAEMIDKRKKEKILGVGKQMEEGEKRKNDKE